MARPRIDNESKTVKEEVIELLLGGLDLMGKVVTFVPPYAGPRYMHSTRLPDEVWEQIQADREKRRVIKDLQEKKWIESKKVGNKMLVEISSHALVQHLKQLVRTKDIELPNDQVCFVMFDFPNGASKARDSWRHFLYSVGFKKFQLSVLSTNKDVADELVAISQLLGIDKWVKVIVGNEWT